GLVTLSQAIAVNMGATLGTTSTPWMVAILGLRLRIATAALPILGVGAFLWLIARGKTRSLGAVLAGYGLIFTGFPAIGHVRHQVEPRCAGWDGLRRHVDSRRHRHRYDGRHAEFERGRGDDTGCAGCGLADVWTRLRDDRPPEHRNVGDYAIGSDGRRG